MFEAIYGTGARIVALAQGYQLVLVLLLLALLAAPLARHLLRPRQGRGRRGWARPARGAMPGQEGRSGRRGAPREATFRPPRGAASAAALGAVDAAPDAAGGLAGGTTGEAAPSPSPARPAVAGSAVPEPAMPEPAMPGPATAQPGPQTGRQALPDGLSLTAQPVLGRDAARLLGVIESALQELRAGHRVLLRRPLADVLRPEAAGLDAARMAAVQAALAGHFLDLAVMDRNGTVVLAVDPPHARLDDFVTEVLARAGLPRIEVETDYDAHGLRKRLRTALAPGRQGARPVGSVTLDLEALRQG